MYAGPQRFSAAGFSANPTVRKESGSGVPKDTQNAPERPWEKPGIPEDVGDAGGPLDVEELVRRQIAFLLALVSVAAFSFQGGHAAPEPYTFKVGAAVRDITPNATVAPPDGCVWLGGFGIGTGNNRRACPGAPGSHAITARAMAVSNGADTLIFGINETQGMFAAYTDGPWGHDDARKMISEQTGVPINHIVLASNHSHRGPDTTGVWGGLPASYMLYIRNQVVAAAVEAVQTMQPATIRTGFHDDLAAYGGDSWDGVDGGTVKDLTIRALQARGADGKAIATFVEVPYHSTVHGSAVSVHPDYEGILEESLEAKYGGRAIVWPGDIGRQYAGSRETLNQLLLDDTQASLDSGWDVSDSTVSGVVKRVLEPVTNPLYIYFLSAAKTASLVTCVPGPGPQGSLCTPVDRAKIPPHGAGVFASIYATAFRIGDIFFAGGGGEVYPNVQQDLVANVRAGNHMFLGMAQDQVGYMIAHTEAWVGVVSTQPDSDNWIFNGSPTMGDHLECTQLAGASEIGFTVSGTPDRCTALTVTDGPWNATYPA